MPKAPLEGVVELVNEAKVAIPATGARRASKLKMAMFHHVSIGERHLSRDLQV